MTADLPALLQRAAQALPGRVAFVGPRCAAVQLAGEERRVYYGLPTSHIWLEAACREEMNVRGWTESLTNWRTHYAAVVRGTHDRVIGHAEAPAPSEALLRAVLMGLHARDDV